MLDNPYSPDHIPPGSFFVGLTMPESTNASASEHLLTGVGSWADDISIERHANLSIEMPPRNERGSRQLCSAQDNYELLVVTTQAAHNCKRKQRQRTRQTKDTRQHRQESAETLGECHLRAMLEVQFLHPALEKGQVRQQGNSYACWGFSNDQAYAFPTGCLLISAM
ncbi:hypothetical protein F4779DRAFT_192191 [Xylariaceae sp. FL0662B]|nr:hypothetical protein F4779DRAFT_192191 [Xylariaceae sp. FL0662B]